MISCEVTIRKKSWSSAWWVLKVTRGQAVYRTDGRVKRGGVDLQDRCFGAIFLAIEGLAEASGLDPGCLAEEGWVVFREAAKQLAAEAD